MNDSYIIALPNGELVAVDPRIPPEEAKKRLMLQFPEQFEGGVMEGLRDTAAGLVRGVGVLGEIVHRGAKELPVLGPAIKLTEALAPNLTKESPLDQAEDLAKQIQSPTRDAKYALGEKLKKEKGEVAGTLEWLKERPSVITDVIAESVPQTLGGGVVGRAIVGAGGKAVTGLAAGAVGEGLISAESAIIQMERELGRKLTQDEIAVLSASGFLTGLISYGSGKALSRFGVKDIDALLAEGKISQELGSAMKRLLLRSAFEGLEETPQSMQETAAQNIVAGRPIGEDVKSAGILGFAAGAGTSAVLSPFVDRTKKEEPKAWRRPPPKTRPKAGPEQQPPGGPAPQPTAEQAPQATAEQAPQPAAEQTTADVLYNEAQELEREIAELTKEAEEAVKGMPPMPTQNKIDEVVQSLSKAQLARLEVETAVYDEKEQRFVRKPVSADKALEAAQDDVDRLNKLLDCLQRGECLKELETSKLAPADRATIQDGIKKYKTQNKNQQEAAVLAVQDLLKVYNDGLNDVKRRIVELVSPETLKEPEEVKVPPPVRREPIDVRQLADFHMSEEVLNNPDNFMDPNTSVPRTERKVKRVIGGKEEWINKPFGEVLKEGIDTSQGPIVLQVGEDSNVRPRHYLRSLVKDIYAVAREADPTGVYVILPEDVAVKEELVKEEVPQVASFVDNGVHYIIPRHLTNINIRGSHISRGRRAINEYSGYAKFDAWSTLQHEFGHGVIERHLFEGLTPDEQERFRWELETTGQAPQDLLQKLKSPAAQMLIQRYVELRQQIEGDKIPGKEAAARTLSPAKLQKKNIFVERGVDPKKGYKASEFLSAFWPGDRFTLEEFVAEQFPKFYYGRGDYVKSFLFNTVNIDEDAKAVVKRVEEKLLDFYGDLLASLRRVHRQLQLRDIIGAEKEFKAWFEELAGKARELDIPAEPTLFEDQGWTVTDNHTFMHEALQALVQANLVNSKSNLYSKLNQLAVKGQVEEFVEATKPLLRHRYRFDESVVKAIELKEWKEVRKEFQGNKEAFSQWFADSFFVDGDGEPMTYFYALGTDTAKENSVFFSNPAHTPITRQWLNTPEKERRILQAFLSIKKDELAFVTLKPDEILNESAIDNAAEQAKGKRGVVFQGGNIQGFAVVPLDPEAIRVVEKSLSLPTSRVYYDVTSATGKRLSKAHGILQKAGAKASGYAVASLTRLSRYLLQINQIAALHPEWDWLREFRRTMTSYYRQSALGQNVADNAIRHLTSYFMGKESIAILRKLTWNEYVSGQHLTEIEEKFEPLGRFKLPQHKVSQRLLDELKNTYGVDVDSIKGKRIVEAYLALKNSTQFLLNQLYISLRYLVQRRYRGNPALSLQKVKELDEAFATINNLPYWPQAPLGDWRINVVAPFTYTTGLGNTQTVMRTILEVGADSDSEAQSIAAELEEKIKNLKGARVEKYLLPNRIDQTVFRLPFGFVEEVAASLGIQPGTKEYETLKDLTQITPKDRLERLLELEKRRTLKFNPYQDFIRSYAAFSQNMANFVAKILYRRMLQDAIEAGEDMAMRLPAKESVKLWRTIETMRRTVDYMMNPHEEMQTARGAITLIYLLGQLDTALMNILGLTQTWGYLNRELGYLKGTSALISGFYGSAKTLYHEYKDLALALLQGAHIDAVRSVTDPTWEMVNGRPTELRQALNRAREEGVVMQSYAYYLAGQNAKGILHRLWMRSLPGKAAKIGIDLGMGPFRVMELISRRATFIAVYKALQATRPDLLSGERYRRAAELTGLLQGDYTKGNRAQFMRGGSSKLGDLKALMFVFYTWLQNAAWGMYGGMDMSLNRLAKLEGREKAPVYRSYSAQLILITLALGGLMGLPFMEDILDLLNPIAKKLYGKSAEQMVYEALKEVDDDPLPLMYGLTFDVGGISLSGSVSYGDIIPATEELANVTKPADAYIGGVVKSALGVPGSFMHWVASTALATLNSPLPGDTLMHKLAAGPGIIGNIGRTYEWAQLDGRGPKGGLLFMDENGRPREVYQWELIARGLGFQPTAWVRRQRARMEAMEAAEYWRTWRKALLDAYFHAKYVEKDREATADVWREIKEYNSNVPDQRLAIISKKLERSMEERHDAAYNEEHLRAHQKSEQVFFDEAYEKYFNLLDEGN